MMPIDDVAFLTHPRHNIAWMTMLEEIHAAQRPFASIYVRGDQEESIAGAPNHEGPKRRWERLRKKYDLKG